MATPVASGTKRISTCKKAETRRLAPAVSRKPMPKSQNERRAPARATRNPALMLAPTIKSRPIPVCGVWSASPCRALMMKAACIESIRPARQTAQVTRPAANDKSSEINNDFQVNVFKTGRSGRYDCEMRR